MLHQVSEGDEPCWRAGSIPHSERRRTPGCLASLWRVPASILTATRRNEALYATRAEIVGAEWTIPAARYKTKIDHVIPLSQAAQSALSHMGVPGEAGGWLFSANGRQVIGSHSRHKAAMDQASGVTNWVIHHLRRTARSLMSRAGVQADHAERCLGHVIGGVRGVYDRHEYLEEKRLAFESLASLVDRIVDPQANVVPLRGITST